MAAITKVFTRLASRPATFSTLKTIPNKPSHLPTSHFRSSHSNYRSYASGSGASSSFSGLSILLGSGALVVGGAGTYFYYSEVKPFRILTKVSDETAGTFVPTKADYQKVYDLIASRLEEKDGYDDGSYGPVVVRLAWHCSGTYDALTKTGGSNGATMRFAPEGDHGANAGLKAARDFLEPVKKQFPWISYSDLWTLAGVCALQEMQGPQIPWRPGRQDRDVSACTPDGRLPDGAKGGDHLRAIFGRMGFDDREIVALSGAHALGRCHTDRSGFEGTWTFSPTVLTNDFFRLLLEEQWDVRKWGGPKQYQDKGSRSLMMLPTDMALVQDKAFKEHVERYAKDNEVFFKEFKDVVVKLFELGVPFTSKEGERMVLKASE